MTDRKDFRYLVDNTNSVEGLKALYNLAYTQEKEKRKRQDEIEEQIKALKREKKELEEYGWCIPISATIKNRIANLVVGETEC